MPNFSGCRGVVATSTVPLIFGVFRFSSDGVSPHEPYCVFQLVGPATNQLNNPPPALYQSNRYCSTRFWNRGSIWAANLVAMLLAPKVSDPPSYDMFASPYRRAYESKLKYCWLLTDPCIAAMYWLTVRLGLALSVLCALKYGASATPQR